MHIHVRPLTVFSPPHQVFCCPKLRKFCNNVSSANLKAIEIKLKKQEKVILEYNPNIKILCIKFNNNCTFRYPAEFLRVESPSAEVQGHGTTQGKRVR